MNTSALSSTVSARKQLERQLHEQTEQLLVANRRKDEFLAMLAHELRNPLAPLRNAVYLLDTPDAADPAQLAGLLPTMRRQIEYLVRLVDDLLDAARISEGKITIERDVVELQSGAVRGGRNRETADRIAQSSARTGAAATGVARGWRQHSADPDVLQCCT